MVEREGIKSREKEREREKLKGGSFRKPSERILREWEEGALERKRRM